MRKKFTVLFRRYCHLPFAFAHSWDVHCTPSLCQSILIFMWRPRFCHQPRQTPLRPWQHR